MNTLDARGRVFLAGQVGEMATGKLVWVDQATGNDDFGLRERMDRPFATLERARDAAKGGDTIVVLPGAYSPGSNLATVSVNWHFMAGAIVTGSSAGVPIFNVNFATDLRITGAGDFDAVESQTVLSVSHLDAVVQFSARNVVGLTSAVKVTLGNVRVEAVLLIGLGVGLELLGGTVAISADKIETTGGLHALYIESGEIRLRSHTIASPENAVFCTGDANVEIEAYEIRGDGSLLGLSAVIIDGTDATLTIRNARVISGAAASVSVDGGFTMNPPKLRLWNCFFSAPEGSFAIVGSGTPHVGIYGRCSANGIAHTDIVIIGPALVAELLA